MIRLVAQPTHTLGRIIIVNGGGGEGSEFLGKFNKRGIKINEVGNYKKRRGKRFDVAHKGSSKLGITALGQARQMQYNNGPKNIPVWQPYQIEHFRFKN